MHEQGMQVLVARTPYWKEMLIRSKREKMRRTDGHGHKNHPGQVQ
jgi:hypothetical protein